MHSGEAYDFSLFENHANLTEHASETRGEKAERDNIIALPDRAARKHEKARLHKHIFKAVASCALIALMVGVFGGFVYGQVQLSELAVKVSNANTTLSEQQSVYTQLHMKSEAQQSLSAVEDKATKQLGMSKIDPSRLETVEWNTADKGQVLQKTSDSFLTTLWERITSLLS